jgi:parallel beta-helix repeat protein
MSEDSKRAWKRARTFAAVSLIILVFFGFSLSTAKPKLDAQAKVYVGSQDFSTIQEAINAANATDTICVLNGTYYEHLVVNKSVSLIGENWMNTIVDGSGSGQVVRVTANGVRISGFTVRNGGICGISITNCHTQNVSGNLISVNGIGQGIYVENSTDNTFSCNNFTACGLPMKFQNVETSLVFQNHFLDNYGPSVSLYLSRRNTLKDNSIRGNGAYGIYLERSENNTVNENNITEVCEGIHLNLSNNNTVAANTVTHTSPYGIILEYSNDTIIRRNVIADDNSEAMVLRYCNGNIVNQNRIMGNKWGVIVFYSSGNIFTGNIMDQNWFGSLDVYGLSLSDFLNAIDVSNTVNGKPVYYWVNQHDREVPSDAGYVAVVNSTEIRIRNLNLTGNYHGVLLAFSNRTSMNDLWISGNFHGLWLWHSNENTITGCTLKDNVNALHMGESSGNLICGNNFVHEQRPEVAGTENNWDNGYLEGGNYWSDYVGSDNFHGVSQNITGSDGLGDGPHVMDPGNQDRFPLMAPVTDFDAGYREDADSCIQIISNSTVSAFHFNASEGPFIHFIATGSNATVGCCRITIPKQLLWAENGKWNVTVGDQTITPLVTKDGNHTYLFFTYTQGSMDVKIQGTHVIPEYSRLFPGLLLAFTAIVAVCLIKPLARHKDSMA